MQINLDEESAKILAKKAEEMDIPVDQLANAAIKAASKAFSDLGMAYAESDTMLILGSITMM